MTVSDYILDYLASLKVKHVFLITGGAIAFVVDAFHKRKDISYICMAHEQACAMAADAYARMGPGIGATMVTSGPGATNLITGICCSWFDSIPTIHITGQVNTFEQKGKLPVRQIGFQETDIVSVVKPITKLAEQLQRPEDIRYLLEKAVYYATTGRPGPVLLDIPQNFQRAEIDPTKLKSFIIPKKSDIKDSDDRLRKKVEQSIKLLKAAKRPILIVGFGVRIAHAEREIKQLVELYKIPVVTTWSAFDLFTKSEPLLVGEIGVYGNRGANFAVQNADVVLSIGARLDTRTTGGKPDTFARKAKKIVVDIDKAELQKRRGLTPDISVQTDAKEFITAMISQSQKNQRFDMQQEWRDRCQVWKIKYPAVKKEYFDEKNQVNAYTFIKTLSDELSADDIIIPDDGGHLTWTMQAFELKKGQRLFSAYGNSPMGYAFPAAIGASIAQGKKRVICIDGDGSIQMNIQEMQTIFHHKLPIKIFIVNNKGYGIIKQFQELYLDARFEASGKGYSAPDFIKIAKAYGIHAVQINNHKELRKKIREVLAYAGPVVCDVQVKENQKIIPKLEFGKPIEDLSPTLPREEFYDNMIVPVWENRKMKGEGV